MVLTLETPPDPDLQMELTMNDANPPTLSRTLVGVLAVFGTVMLVGGTDRD